MNLFYQPQVAQGILHLDPDESRHVVKVLRKKEGDRIRLTDGKGSFYDATINHPDVRKCTFVIDHKFQEQPKNFIIHIAISPTKNADRIEWFVGHNVSSVFVAGGTGEFFSLSANEYQQIITIAVKNSCRTSACYFKCGQKYS